ncbi:unnamed protein product, partial [Owenia fusiformis]
MSEKLETPIDDHYYANLDEIQPAQKASKTETGDFNEYTTLGERNPEENKKNPTYDSLPKRQEEKPFLLKCKWKIIIAGAFIVNLLVECIVIGLIIGGVFQGETKDDIVTIRKEVSNLTAIIREQSSLTKNIISWKADIIDTLKII